MRDLLVSPSIQVSHIRHASAESERGLRFAAFLDRLAAREADRDGETGLTAAEATTEWAYRARARYAYHRRIESPHNPVGRA